MIRYRDHKVYFLTRYIYAAVGVYGTIVISPGVCRRLSSVKDVLWLNGMS